MIQGMTGFGAAERNGFRVEVRSLNHRFLDISVRTPAALSRHEMPIRDALQKRFDRGKFDVYVSTSGPGELRFNLNAGMAREVRRALGELGEAAGTSGEIGIDTLLQWKDLFLKEEISYDEDTLFGAFEEAVAGLEQMRLKEGRDIAREIESRAGRLEELNGKVAAIAPEAMASAKEKYFGRLKDLLAEKGCEDSKLMQEAASLAERADITEEITRLRNHIAHMRDIIRAGGTVGRKLDFLLQELNREANTIASKTDDFRITELVIDMKTEIEKTREQVQNIQ